MFRESESLPALAEEVNEGTLRVENGKINPTSFVEFSRDQDRFPSLRLWQVFPTKQEREAEAFSKKQILAYRISELRKLKIEVDEDPIEMLYRSKIEDPEDSFSEADLARLDWMVAENFQYNSVLLEALDRNESRLRAGIRDKYWEEYYIFDNR